MRSKRSSKLLEWMIMALYARTLSALRSNPGVVTAKRLIWLIVISVFVFALSGFLNQFRGLLVSDTYAVTVLVVGDGRLGIAHFDPKSQTLYKLLLPEKMQLIIDGQVVEAGKLWTYAREKGDPFRVTKESLIGFFGMNFDGYVEDRDWKEGEFEVSLAWVRSPKTRSSLKLWDRYNLNRLVGKLESQKVVTENLPMSVVERKPQPDGYEALILIKDKFDLFAGKVFGIEALEADRRTVAVINATGVSGQARSFERVLKTAGAGVVGIEEGNSESGRCKVVYRGDKKGVVEWLTTRYSCSALNDENTNRQAEVIIYLEKNWPLID